MENNHKISFGFGENNPQDKNVTPENHINKEIYQLNNSSDNNAETNLKEQEVLNKYKKVHEEKKKTPITLKTIVFFIFDIIFNLGIIILLIFIIRTYLIAPFIVYGTSMCDTLNVINGKCNDGEGEYIIVNRFSYLNFGNFKIGDPQRGDIVVFIPPNKNEKHFIKRIIGLPGDTVELKNGDVYIKPAGKNESFKLDEPYLNDLNQGKTNPDLRSGKLFKVPEDNFFVMGDNRRYSNDSRHCFLNSGCKNGDTNFLPRENVEGKAWFVLMPIWNIRVLE